MRIQRTYVVFLYIKKTRFNSQILHNVENCEIKEENIVSRTRARLKFLFDDVCDALYYNIKRINS
jgi:hypothetical protein